MNPPSRLLVLILASLGVCVSTFAAPPNLIVIFTDDQGYADLGVQGVRSDLKTPHLDALAASGVRCTSGYITAPQCSPSRAGLLTGRYQQRFGLEEIADTPMPAGERSLAERLKPAGYVSGMVGKWHLDASPSSVAWITADPPTITTWVNGQQILSHTEPKSVHPAQGHIALQIHDGPSGAGGVVRYRNIRIKRL